MQTWELGHVLLSTLNLLNCCIFYRKEMAFAPPKNPESRKMQTKMSTWTPLNHQLMNGKVFEERRNLLGKWFDKWTDGQRRSVLMDLLERCSPSQLKFFAKQLQDRVPAEALDFTRRLPRALSLYIFSFLDPRSLSRCAQVSWHWKYLTELDQVWMRKCLRYGWYINFSPTPFEQGIWKRHYIEMVKELQVTPPKTPPKYDFVVVDVQPVAKEVLEMKPSLSSVLHSASLLGKKMSKDKRELPPWRSSDKHPTDTIRFNYLDNFDPIEEARQAFPDTTETESQVHLSYFICLDVQAWETREGEEEGMCKREEEKRASGVFLHFWFSHQPQSEEHRTFPRERWPTRCLKEANEQDVKAAAFPTGIPWHSALEHGGSVV